MNERDQGIMETQLHILITDFQRFRDEQRIVNKELTTHGNEETEVQAKILTTLNWHTVIGSFMMATIMYILFKIL